MSDVAFAPGSTDLKPEWQARVKELPDLLREKPSVVRLAYATGADDSELVKRRTQALIRQIDRMWRALPGAYPLQIEEESRETP